MTQCELAKKLGVSNQAVSKWEKGLSMPELRLLPFLAEIFKCSIDTLFSYSGSMQKDIHYDMRSQLPWEDDGVIRGVVFEGTKMLTLADDIADRFIFEIRGEAKSVSSQCNVEVFGSVTGGCSAEGDVNVTGDLSGGCNNNGGVNVGGNFFGGCRCCGDLICHGNICGDVKSGGNVIVSGEVFKENK